MNSSQCPSACKKLELEVPTRLPTCMSSAWRCAASNCPCSSCAAALHSCRQCWLSVPRYQTSCWWIGLLASERKAATAVGLAQHCNAKEPVLQAYRVHIGI